MSKSPRTEALYRELYPHSSLHDKPDEWDEPWQHVRRLEAELNSVRPEARKFRGVGHLERTGYIPAGSATEREAALPEVGRQGYYIACFRHPCDGHILWWGPDRCGYTPDIATAGIYSDVSWLDSKGDVPVPVGFIDTLRVRRMADTGDSKNDCLHHPDKLRAAIQSYMNNSRSEE